MAAEQFEHLAGWDSVQDTLGEIRAGHQEFQNFFTEVFDQLGSLSTEVSRQHDRWETERQETDARLQMQTAQLEEDRAALASDKEQLERSAHEDADSQAAQVDGDRFEEVLEEIQQQRTELRGAQEAAAAQVEQLATVNTELAAIRAEGSQQAAGIGDERLEQFFEEVKQQRCEMQGMQVAAQAQVEQLGDLSSELTDTRSEFAEARDEMLRRQEALKESGPPQASTDEELQERFRKMAQQHTSLEQERSVLEAELEAVRNRAAEMAESLADEKRHAAQQQSEWTGELKRMRRLLESMSGRLADGAQAKGVVEPPRREPAVAGVATGSSPAGGDPVLDSVAAQFEILQKNLARRRAAKSSMAGS